jgi:hypothetical protein
MLRLIICNSVKKQFLDDESNDGYDRGPQRINRQLNRLKRRQHGQNFVGEYLGYVRRLPSVEPYGVRIGPFPRTLNHSHR